MYLTFLIRIVYCCFFLLILIVTFNFKYFNPYFNNTLFVTLRKGAGSLGETACVFKGGFY